MASAIAPAINKVVSSLKASGLFKRVQTVEPKGAPDSGLTAAVYLASIQPAARVSGLSSVSGVYLFTIRIYTNMLQEPTEKIDEVLADCVDKVFNRLAADFDLTNTVMNIDIFGEHGTPLRATAGYVEVDHVLYRSVDITLPLVVSDTWVLV